MIYNLRRTVPKIKFDNNDTVLTVSQGDTFKVWLDSVYKDSGDYDFQFVASGMTVVKVSDYEYNVTANNLGFNKISYRVTFDRNFEMRSNVLTVFVTP